MKTIYAQVLGTLEIHIGSVTNDIHHASDLNVFPQWQ